MYNVIGTCSICGGDVVAYTGIWMSVAPPSPPSCRNCGAVPAASQAPVIPMVPRRYPAIPQWIHTVTLTGLPLSHNVPAGTIWENTATCTRY